MKRCTFLITILMLLLSVSMVSALSEETLNVDSSKLSFPTPIPETNTGLHFPTPVPKSNNMNVLPNLSRVLKAPGKIVHEQIDMGMGLIVNSFEYRVASISKETVDAYLGLCSQEGYAVEAVTISGISAYQITDGDYTAFFMPSYDNDFPLLIVQTGMPLQPVAEDNTLYLTMNGKSYILQCADHKVNAGKTGRDETSQPITGYAPESQGLMFFGSELLGESFAFKSGADGPGDVVISIPTDAIETSYLMQKSYTEDSIGIQINSNIYCGLRQKTVMSTSVSFLGTTNGVTGIPFNSKTLISKYDYSIVAQTDALKSSGDYLKLTVEYMDGNICQCSFEGSFNSGKDSLFGSFRYVP